MDEDEIVPQDQEIAPVSPLFESQEATASEVEGQDDQPFAAGDASLSNAAGSSAALPLVQPAADAKKHKKFGAEWSLFTDAGKWKQKDGKEGKFRLAVCNHCRKQFRGKLETLANHIQKCFAIPPNIRKMYLQSQNRYLPSDPASEERNAKRQKLGLPGRTAYYSKAFNKKDLDQFQKQLCRALLSANVPFKLVNDFEFEQLLKMFNGTIKTSTANTYRRAILPGVASSIIEKDRERDSAHGVDITLSLDGWKTPTKRKWLGYCKPIRRRRAFTESANFQHTSVRISSINDVTIEGENEAVVKIGLQNALESIMKELDNSNSGSRVVAVVTNSAGCNVKAKKALATVYPSIVFLPCFAHQLNLFAGNLLNHPSCKQLIQKSSTMVSFFNTHSSHMAKLKTHMRIIHGRDFEFVVSGQTRWYSHFGQILSIFKAKSSLIEYKDQVDNESEPYSEKVTTVLDIIGTSSYWRDLQLISKILRPITKEIGINERRGANMNRYYTSRSDEFNVCCLLPVEFNDECSNFSW